MDDPDQPEYLICRQIFDNLLLHRLVDFDLGATLRHSACRPKEVLVHLGETDVTTANQVVQVVEAWWLVLDKHQQQMRA